MRYRKLHSSYNERILRFGGCKGYSKANRKQEVRSARRRGELVGFAMAKLMMVNFDERNRRRMM